MFELPEAKRVRREDLQQADESSWDVNNGIAEDEELQARINAQIAAALGLDDEDYEHSPIPAATSGKQNAQRGSTQESSGAHGDPKSDDENDDEQGYEFNLFSTGASTGPSKVILEDAATLGDGAFVRPRPLSCYTTTALSTKQKEQYSDAAVTADDVARWSIRPSWGMAMPWRVVSISGTTRKARPGKHKSMDILTGNTEGGDGDAATKKKRPGKKQRIVMRKQRTTREQAMEEAAKKQTEKEEQIKDKKKRLNRIKKLRKRAKEKEKKLEGGGGGEAAGDGDGSSSDDDE